MQFFKNFTLFQKLFFIVFTILSLLAFFLPVLFLGQDFDSVFTTLGIIGLISAFSGVLVSIYTAKASISGYIWWWINTATFAVIAIAGHLYGQFIQNIFILLPLQVYGFIAWRRNMSANESDEIAIRRFTKKETLMYLGASVICFVLYALFLNYLPNIMHGLFGIKIAKDPQILLDSITSTLTIMAVYLTGKRYVEQWHYWLVSNSLGLIMFVIQTLHAGSANPSMLVGDLSNTISILQYGVGAIYGFILWKQMYKAYKEKQKAKEELKIVA
ncbi:MAG: nicotinamide riboside transporter PnuC [Sarcina sp.]